MSRTPTTSSTPMANDARIHALDAVRASALLLGVFFHATMSFLPGQQIWMVRDEESTSLGVVFFVSHIFRMPMFFLIAGFFARLSLHRRGLGGFVRDRLRRIAIPLVAFWPPLFIAVSAIYVWGLSRQFGPEVLEQMAQPEGSLVETFPLTHLWFLYVLLGLYAASLTLRGLLQAWVDRDGRACAVLDKWLNGMIRSGLAPFVLAVPTTVALCFHEPWLMWLGVPSPDRGLIPNTAALAAYGSAFGFGWLLQRQTDVLPILERRWILHLAAAIALSAVCIGIAGVTVTLEASSQPAAHDPKLRFALAAAYPVATWMWTFGAIGLAMRYLSQPNRAIRYLADASYWIYLIHLPILMVAQVLVFPLQFPALAKYALVLVIAFPIMPLSFHWMVRYSALGALLNGRRHPRPG